MVTVVDPPHVIVAIRHALSTTLMHAARHEKSECSADFKEDIIYSGKLYVQP